MGWPCYGVCMIRHCSMRDIEVSAQLIHEDDLPLILFPVIHAEVPYLGHVLLLSHPSVSLRS